MRNTRRVPLFSVRSRHGLGMLPTVMLAQTFSEVHFAWQAQHFGSLRRKIRGRRSILCPCTVSWQARHVRKAKYIFHGRRGTFARSRDSHLRLCLSLSLSLFPFDLSIHLSITRYRFRGRRRAFARPSTDFVAGAALSQGQVQIDR